MATVEQIAELREFISESDESMWTDIVLGQRIDANAGDLNITAANLWRAKASHYAEMVDISEAGSSRKNSQLYKNALEMAAYYAGLGETPAEQAAAESPRTRAIVRP